MTYLKQYKVSLRSFILPIVYSKPMTTNKINSQVVKMAIVAIATLVLVNVSVAMAQHELINTATNEIANVNDLGKRDVLEEIYTDLDSKAEATQSTFILVEQPNEQVTLFTIDYPYEDYLDTDIPMVELGTYDLMELWNN